MIKNMLFRTINSFCYSIAITMIVLFIGYLITGQIPLLPEYAARFNEDTTALVVELLLVGVMSGVLAGGTVILEFERWSLLVQSIVYFVISSSVWIFVASLCWGFAKYPASAISTTVSYLASYTICWIIQYKTCKRNIDEINNKLSCMGRTQ